MSGAARAQDAGVLRRLKSDQPLVAVELRPPKLGMSTAKSMDTWIDMYHAVRRLGREDSLVFLTDNAVGEAEEENLNHLTSNFAGETDHTRLVPFLTCKHSLDYCLMYADRAASFGFEALTVLGGDSTVGPARCVEYAYMLRGMIRERVPTLSLGGWANPHREPEEQVAYLAADSFHGDFYLTQVVSHHAIRQVERFVGTARRRGVSHPAVFGVFLYRSANPRTFQRLERFFPVPAEGVAREFAAGDGPIEIAARTIRALREVGADKVYVSNLGFRRPAERYRHLLEAVGSA